MTDPWRYRCPECDSTQLRRNVSVKEQGQVITKQLPGGELERHVPEKYVCERCDYEGSKKWDAKEARLVS